MIALSIFHIFFILVAAFLVLKVYRLVKLKDIGILMSITSVLLSLTSKKQICSLHFLSTAMLIWLISFIFFFHAADTSILKTTNMLRVLNFTGTMFFGMALVSDLYKWSTFLVGTSTYQSQRRDLYVRNMRLCKMGLIIG